MGLSEKENQRTMEVCCDGEDTGTEMEGITSRLP